jgi:hypothetical protein
MRSFTLSLIPVDSPKEDGIPFFVPVIGSVPAGLIVIVFLLIVIICCFAAIYHRKG